MAGKTFKTSRDTVTYIPIDGVFAQNGNVAEPEPEPNGHSYTSFKRKSTKYLYFHGLLLAISSVLFFASLALSYRIIRPHGFIDSTNFYSPVLEKLDLPLRVQQVRDTRYPSDDPMAVYREPPNPIVDAAWDRISDVQAILINSAEVTRLGKDPKSTVRAPESWGYGNDAHWAEIDVFHQVHCLNSIRQALYREYYTGKDNDTNPLAWGHISHCLHNLLQSLMCSASADVVTYNWVENKPKPVPDFNINKKCRDFELLLKWQNDHKLPNPREKWEEIAKPLGASLLPMDTSGTDEEE